MKKILSLVLIAGALLFAAPPSLHAQDISYVTAGNGAVLNGGTNNIPVGLSNLVRSASMPVAYAKDVALSTSFKLSGAGTAGVLLRFNTSVDNSKWFTNAISFWIPGTGAAETTYVTNFTIGGIPFLQLNEIHNTNSVFVTNLVVRYSAKRGL